MSQEWIFKTVDEIAYADSNGELRSLRSADLFFKMII